MTPRVSQAIDAAAAAHGVTREDILGRARNRRAFVARREAMRAIRAYTRADGSPIYSLHQVAAVFGRHHTTVLAALKSTSALKVPRAQARRPVSKRTVLTADDVRRIRQALSEGMSGERVAKVWNIDRHHASNIKTRKAWAHVE